MSKEVTLLVGPQASGKTTFTKSNYPNHFRISQDDMGQKEHWNIYLKALQRGQSDIVIDRINHTREQRTKYILAAKQYGFSTKIVELYESYKTCYMRGFYRDNHPTIQNKETLKKALQMYFDKYEAICNKEADIVVKTKNNPLVLDLTELFNQGKRFIVIGDLHGCFDELENLLNKVNYNKETDIVVLCGDLVDRGPKIYECLKFLLDNNNVYSVQGNHDNKYLRWLNMSKVNIQSLEETIKQTWANVSNEDLEQWHLDLFNKLHHTIIKFGNNYVTHAGFHPHYHPEETSKEFSLYARVFDTNSNTFARTGNTKWYQVDRKYRMYNLFFGHDVHEFTSEVTNSTGGIGIYSADAGCVFGNELRGYIVKHDSKFGTFIQADSVKSSFSIKKDIELDYMNKFEPYDKLVEQGFLRKQESGDLVLYNYTEKCTYEKHWNEYTMDCRGLILDKVNESVVARPFPKFFNLSELESPQLPKIPVGEKYDVYEKLDGSLGILYYHPNEKRLKIATRGSFESDQAKKATEIFYKNEWDLNYELLAKHQTLIKDYTFCFEIIYPANRMNDGARLVSDYGNLETLILLGGIHKETGKDLDYRTLYNLAEMWGVPLAKKFDFTIEQLIEMKKILPMQEEGWVIRFENGFRVKVKGDEYCKMQKILNSITPLSIWEVMKDNLLANGKCELSIQYKTAIPEEILPEVNDLEKRIKFCFNQLNKSIIFDYHLALKLAKQSHPENINKGLGLQLVDLEHRGAIFPLHNNNLQQYHKYVMMNIRPTNNEVK